VKMSKSYLLYIRSIWANAQNGPRGQYPVTETSLHLVDL
jgi:hypothetical protein